jgi:Tfp pilus assembly ATPase PilU
MHGILESRGGLVYNTWGARVSRRIHSEGQVLARIDSLLDLMIQMKASDLHVSVGAAPMLRINGELQKIKHPDLHRDETKHLLYEILTRQQV